MGYARRLMLVVIVASIVAVTVFVPSAATVGVWLTPEEIRDLPTSGPAWENVKVAANSNLSGMTLMTDINSDHDTYTLAAAYAFVRLGGNAYRAKVAQEISRAIGSECTPVISGSRHLGIARNTASYVIAAQLIDLADYDSALESRFRNWILLLRDAPCGNSRDSLKAIHEDRTNNHGTMAASGRAAVSAYLGDTADLARTAQVLRGWMGDRAAFSWPLEKHHSGSETWMPDPAQPRPVNPVRAVVRGRNVDGAQPQEQARCGKFRWPPCESVYPWAGLSGSIVAAEILRRNGHPAIFLEQSSAIMRGYEFLRWLATHVDSYWWSWAQTAESFQPWLANWVYDTDFPAYTPSSPTPGKNMGWTDWTHVRRQTLPLLVRPLETPSAFGRDRTAPKLRGLRVIPGRLRAHRRARSVSSARRTAQVNYTLSEAAKVRFGLRRARLGRRVGRRCVRSMRRNRRADRCVRYRRLRGGFTHAGRAGRNSFELSRRVRGRRLPAGRYRLVATPTDMAGNRGRSVRTTFSIVRRLREAATPRGRR
jgi:alginate lyase